MLLIAWIVPTALLIGVFVIYPESLFLNIAVILGWLLTAFQFTWNHSEVFYLRFKRLWFLVKNPDCIWNLSIEYSGQFDIDIFSDLDSKLYDYTNDINIRQISQTRKSYRVKTINFELYYDEHYDVLRFELSKLELSYRRSLKMMDEEMNFIIELLSRTIKEDNTEYYFDITFKDDFNPFYGFFIRRLNANDISKFNIAFNVEEDKITVNKNSIKFYTTSLQKLNSISKRYLTLSPP